MPKPGEIFEFVIDGYTPDTLPMARLAQYLLDLAALLGEPDHVHFDRVADGSARAIQRVDEVAVTRVRAHVAEARLVTSNAPARRAFESLDAKLREDGTTASLSEVREDQRARLLFFPGSSRDSDTQLDPVYGPITQPGTVQGRIISVGGSARLANVNIEQPDETTYYCEATRDLAMELAPLIYKYDVRVMGTGKYIRKPDGTWEMRSFRITDYEKLNQRSLSEVIERLRGVTRKVGLDKTILRQLADLRGDGSEA